MSSSTNLPTTTSSGDPEIHHHQQAHELHILNAELLANAATITTTTNCITVCSQSNELGVQLLPTDHQPSAPPAVNNGKEVGCSWLLASPKVLIRDTGFSTLGAFPFPSRDGTTLQYRIFSFRALGFTSEIDSRNI
jgi:hypothetical protein